ncbi:MAG: hypothetical protein E7371_00015 [Clostridiales bacterium]|nr:hypothetical protein [Clostridiales bacterium]
MKILKKFRKQAIKASSILWAATFLGAVCIDTFAKADNALNPIKTEASYVQKVNSTIDTKKEAFYDESVVYQLPDTVAMDDEISVIVTMNTASILETYLDSNSKKSVTDYIATREARKIESNIERERKALIKQLNYAGIQYELGEQYDTVLSGFEITLKAKDFEKVGKLLKDDASLMIGEVYNPAVTEIVTNDVDVYDTGIFKGLDNYKGDGVLVAVLDTGLDYTHTAFNPDNFPDMGVAFTKDTIAEKIGNTVAATSTAGLTAEDVYLNKKVPYAYDYADKDPDVLPINNEHGTHVAGIIAGKDDTIMGVAPNAQLAIMKVFSDTKSGAKSSWIMAGVEDAVNLGVDVINMSLGSACGFAREVDKEKVNRVYDLVRDAGISLIASAANSYNATLSSEKNGSLPLTSNPDSGTVGSPSTYAAALSVASVDGVKTPYIKYGEEIIYFNEASASDGKKRNFVDELLNNYEAQTGIKTDSHDFEYITIPGIGRESDYMAGVDYTGKIVLVKRGESTFEEKVRIALKVMGATGIIIYNNVSGTIGMSVGDNAGPICSISQDEGEMLAAQPSGFVSVSRENVAGPFMSEFSSWGPTSDLQIKPEITAHGGEILSAVPGNGYERMSGTSMAAPNQAGAAALIRQYVRYDKNNTFGFTGKTYNQEVAREVTALVNQLMMSTADIVMNKNGLPYAVRKQGAGLMNLTKATTADAYLTTFAKDGSVMDKTKLELGDDKDKDGVYTMKFAINNIRNTSAVYDLDAIFITEGISETYTSHDEHTVTQDGYLLNPAVQVKGVDGGSLSGNTITVSGNQQATVTVEVTLSDADKQYLEAYFEHGMYVEGFIKLTGKSGSKVNLNVPVLAYYGDWTEAPIFDEEFYDTNKDELNQGLDIQDKVMADAYATRAIGGLYSDYIFTLGTYCFKQDPTATQIAANKNYIAISNQRDESETNNTSAVNSLRSISAGLLRNVKTMDISIVEDSTGEVVFERTESNVTKSYNYGGAIGGANVDIEFSAIEQNLKNNTRYTVTLTGFIDYEGEQNNTRNTFTFPLYIDFEAPAVTDVRYRSEYDKTTKKTKLYADIDIYDNHYAMAMQVGQITKSEDPKYTYSMDSFGKYINPVYSSYNSTSTVTVELTDYIDRIRNNSIAMDKNDASKVEYNSNTFIAVCYDYALNSATYELRIPDEILSASFKEESLTMEAGKTKDLTLMLDVFPSTSWAQTVDFKVDDPTLAEIKNGTIYAKQVGETVLRAFKKDSRNNEIPLAEIPLTITESTGFGGTEAVNKFELTGFYTKKAYHGNSSDDREIGDTDSNNAFGKDGASLSMYPAEEVRITYTLDSYYPDGYTKVVFESMNEEIAKVDSETGLITAVAKGKTYVSADVYYLDEDGEWSGTFYSAIIAVKVKDPFTVNGMYLYSYKGDCDVVEIPGNRGITAIYQYAFSNYHYIAKDENDIIDEEDPYKIKPWYLGESKIKKVIIPEGVTAIESYAFAGITELEEVVLPSTLVRIGVGAFTGCTKLTKINLENAKFINEEAFKNCPLGVVNLSSIVSIGNYTFQNTKLSNVNLPASSQSLGIGAFADNKELRGVNFEAPKMKLGSYVFENCPKLNNVKVNAAVISSYAFYDCEALTTITLGKDVAVIGEFAFTGTNISTFTVEEGGAITVDETNSACLLKNGELILVAPKGASFNFPTTATKIASGAFAGNTVIRKFTAENVETIGDYAFAECSSLEEVVMPNVKSVGKYAFAGTNLTAMPSTLTTIGAYAFAGTLLEKVEIVAGESVDAKVTVGEYAFGEYQVGNKLRYVAETLTEVVINDNVTLGKGAFNAPIYLQTFENTNSLSYYTAYQYYLQDEDGNYIDKDGNVVADQSQAKSYTYYKYDYTKHEKLIPSLLTKVTIGNNVTVGEYAFAGNAKIHTLTFGTGITVNDYAFMNAAFYKEGATVLSELDLSGVTSIGKYAFSGTSLNDYQIIATLDETTEKARQYISEAYRLVYVPGENGEKGQEMILGYQLSTFAPVFKTLNVSGATKIGEGAFAYNRDLETVTLSDSLTAISNYTFALCSSLTNVTLPSSVKSVGEYAFYQTGLADELNLSNVEEIGAYAYTDTAITSVVLKDGATIGEAAFSECEFLTSVDLSKTVSIGAMAFQGTAITKADLSAATEIGDFAFGDSNVTEVIFGDKIESFGENPFYGCAIETYGVIQDVTFNGAVLKQELVETYVINDKIQVIDGVLYQRVNNGLELISYPTLKDVKAYSVAENTVRITARAFYGASLENVTLPWSLKAVGDKAFYDCNNLALVVFKSYDAPILEEDYDTSRLSYDCLAMTGKIGDYEGLGIVKYYMWNPTAQFSNFYFGANFVDFIGDVDKNIVMVKPANGKNYNTFIMNQYFSMIVDGGNALTQEAVDVVGLINKLPTSISLADEDAILIARAAYDKLTSLEQRALITDAYSKLSNAESTLEYLKLNVPVEPEDPGTDVPGDTDDSSSSGDSSSNDSTVTAPGKVGYVVAIVMLSVAVLGLAGFIFWRENKNGTFNFFKEKKTEEPEVIIEKEVAEDAQSETTEAAPEENTAE